MINKTQQVSNSVRKSQAILGEHHRFQEKQIKAFSLSWKIFDAREWLEDDTNVTGTLDKYSVMGSFSIKKAYLAKLPKYPKPIWKKLALLTGIPRHHFVMWLALHKRLSTVDRLCRWGIQLDTKCTLCSSQEEETQKHLFFNCAYSGYMWKTLLNELSISRQIGD